MVNKEFRNQLQRNKTLLIKKHISDALQKIHATTEMKSRWVEGLTNYYHAAHANAAHTWLEHVGSLEMVNIKTESDLIHAAYCAPTVLLFGLAHGRLEETTLSENENSCGLKREKLSSYARDVRTDVFARAYFISEEKGRLDVDYTATKEELWSALISASDDFALGQITSWLLSKLHTE